MKTYASCPRCGKKADPSGPSDGFPLWECTTCWIIYCPECGPKHCPKCGSSKKRDAGRVLPG